MDAETLSRQLTALYADAELLLPERLEQRSEALRLCALAEELAHLPGQRSAGQRLLRLAHEVRARLREINESHFSQWRAAIRTGVLRGPALRALFNRFTRYRPAEETPPVMRYDALDTLIQGLLRLEPPPNATRPPEQGMIHLEHTPARAVLELVDRVPLGPDDLFVDIGAGLGQIAILVHLLTGTPARGIESEPAYVAFAQERALELEVDQARFLCADAREADLTAGTVFFLFAPCFGLMLEEVIARLRQRAQAGPITVCSYGPSSPILAQAPWLRTDDGGQGHPFRLTILHSGAPDGTTPPT